MLDFKKLCSAVSWSSYWKFNSINVAPREKLTSSRGAGELSTDAPFQGRAMSVCCLGNELQTHFFYGKHLTAELSGREEIVKWSKISRESLNGRWHVFVNKTVKRRSRPSCCYTFKCKNNKYTINNNYNNHLKQHLTDHMSFIIIKLLLTDWRLVMFCVSE